MNQIAIAPSELIVRVVLGLVGTMLVVTGAMRFKALSKSGAAAAVLAGTLSVAAGWDFAILLFAFFASATGLSRYRREKKESRTAAIVEKGGKRDAWQVFANGGIFALATLWMIASPNSFAAFAAVGAVSGATADTWATEIGSLSESQPRSILTGNRVPTGTSGGITLLGSTAALAGAVFVAALAWALLPMQGVFFAAASAGIAGAFADSIMGASIQSRRWCETCGTFTERPIHICGSDTKRISGIAWMDNDAVNFVCTLVAAGTAVLWV